ALPHDRFVDTPQELVAVRTLTLFEDRVEEPQAVGIVFHAVEQERVQHFAGEKRRAADALLRDLRARLAGRTLVAHADRQPPVGAEPQRGGERRVQPQASIAIEMLTDADRRKDERDRRGGERVLRGQAGGAGYDERIARPTVDATFAILDEDDRVA